MYIIRYLEQKSDKTGMIKKRIKFIALISIVLISSAFAVFFQKVESAAFSHPADQNCQTCHISEWQDWKGSHHQKSMQVATDETVLGDFSGAEVVINDQSNRFYKKDQEFWVTTEGADYKIDYTFGFEPLQQYLVKMSDGKYQTLPLSWDSRAADRGGQRWFHIYGEDHIPENDRLHWKQPMQNWNGMCADCHSSGLERNYDAQANNFSTNWDKINVGCQSCHGTENNILKMVSSDDGWHISEGDKTATWSGKNRDQSEIEVCAACHSRRTPLTDGFIASDRFLDAFLPSAILMPEYFPDGQVRDEDYVWGSFLQSKMYANGVICSDCHEPHSLELRATGNDMCTTCHLAGNYDRPDHHKHEVVGSSGAECVSCHMPERTYMGVDARRDHSFRIPRPDLNHITNSPDACTACHSDREPAWAAGQINSWYNTERTPHFGEILNAVFTGAPGAEQSLNQLIFDDEIPEIIRGSAIELLRNYPNINSYNAIIKGLSSDQALVRLGAIKGSAFIPVAERTPLLLPLLSDQFKSVRIEAVRALSAITAENLNGEIKKTYENAREEFLNAQNQVTWRGEGHFNLGIFYAAQNEPEIAEKHYLRAMKNDPYFPASYINLADQYRALENEDLTIETIEKGLSLMPADADLNYSKALYLIRAGKAKEALGFLKIAVTSAPNNARYAYVYSIALKQVQSQ